MDYVLLFPFIANKTGKTGISVLVTVRNLDAGTVVVNAQPATEVGDGVYKYVWQNNDPINALATATTADTTVDQQVIHSFISKEQMKLNALPSTPAAAGEYTTALTAIQGKLSSDPLPVVLVNVVGSTITNIRGNDWVIEIPGLILDGKIQFAIKRSDNEPDERSVLFIDSETGLITVNGKPATDPIHAELDYTADVLSMVVDACITAQLAKGTYIYGIQSVSASGDVLERYGGQFVVLGDVVRATE